MADDSSLLRIQLDEQRRYSPRQICAECNRVLHTNYVLDEVSDEPVALSGADLLALAVARWGLGVDVAIEPRAIMLAFPPGSTVESRRRIGLQLRQTFQLPPQPWPPDKGLHLPENLTAERTTVLLIHGLHSDRTYLRRLREACQSQGWQVLEFDYPGDSGIAAAGRRLSQALQQLAEQHPSVRIAVIGHSMGGLVARYALETPGLNPGCIDALITLGTPHAGSRLAPLEPGLKVVTELLPNETGGQAAEDLLPGSALLTELNARSRPEGVAYFVGAGRRSYLSARELEELRRAFDELCRRRGVSAQRRAECNELLAADELRDGSGDGAVSLQSALLSDVQAQRIFDRNHTQLLLLNEDEPVTSDVFRWTVECLHVSRVPE